MSQPGTIVQYSPNDQFGLIHVGGADHAAFLSFAYGSCCGPLQTQLNQGDIPPAASIPVTFDTSFVNGSLVAIGVC
jgi:hypothetical protein